MANNVQHRRKSSVLLMTRTKPDSDRFVDSLSPDVRALTDVVLAPLMRITPTETHPDLTGVAGVIFTSAKAVGFAPDGGGRRALCVGARTAEAARAAGWTVHCVAETAEELIAVADVAGPLVHLSGRHHRGDIAERLSAAGIPCQRHVLYDQDMVGLEEQAQAVLDGDCPVIVPLFSPRTAAQFAQEAACWRQVHILAISAAAKECVGGHAPASVHIAAAPTAEEMRRGVEMLLLKASLP